MKNVSIALFGLLITLPITCLTLPLLGQTAPSANLTSEPAFTDQEKETQRQAAVALLANLQTAVQQGTKAFVIPPGNYRFEGESGHDFRLTDVSGMMIEAAGVTFYFNPRLGVRLINCHGVTIHGLTVDTDPLPWFQGRIVAIDPATPTIDLALEPGYAMPAAGRYRLVFFDGATGRRRPVFDCSAFDLQDLGNNQLRLTKFGNLQIFENSGPPSGVVVGDRVAMLDEGHFGGGNIVLTKCDTITLDTVTLYGAAGFAYNESQGAGGNHYIGCKLVLRPGTNRLMASRADGLHSLVMGKGPLIENCELSHSGDDLLAIHGFFAVITQKNGPRDFVVASTEGTPFSVGTTLHFLRLPNADSGDEAKVAALDPITDRTQLEATKDLPAQIAHEFKFHIRPMSGAALFHLQVDRDVSANQFDLIESPDFCGAGAVIRGNHLHDGNVRGILVKSHDILIENNVVERTAHGGIVLEPEGFWLEGPSERHIQVVGNHISETGWSTFDRVGMDSTMAAIHVGDYFGVRGFPRTLLPNQINEDIVIRNNDIQRPAGFGILLMNTHGAQVDNNRIDTPFAAGQYPTFYDFSHLLLKGWEPDPSTLDNLKSPFYAIYVLASSGVEASGNSVAHAPSFLKDVLGNGPSSPPAPASP